MLRPVLAAVLLCALAPPLHADPVCPPKHYACWQARAAFAAFGEMTVLARARACGWTEAKINEAVKCLHRGPTADELYGCTAKQQAPNGDCP
jgi:hypothetical protein